MKTSAKSATRPPFSIATAAGGTSSNARLLTSKGFRDAYHLGGGIMAWKAAGIADAIEAHRDRRGQPQALLAVLKPRAPRGRTGMAIVIGRQDVLAVLSGGAVGFSLGLIGGGGSILAVPLLLYVVGIGDAHVAIGTSALAVSANAFGNLVGHWRAGNVKWPCAATFAVRRHCRRRDRIFARQAGRRPKTVCSCSRWR